MDVLKILVDKYVNLKELMDFLINEKINCQLYTLTIENKVKKIRNKALPVLVWGSGEWGNGRWNDGIALEEIKKIIGKENLADALHLESALFYKIDYLITEDKDILHKKTELEEAIKELKIMNIKEFLCRKSINRV